MEELYILLSVLLSWIFVCTMYLTISNKNKDNVEVSNNDKILYGFSIIIFIITLGFQFIFVKELYEKYGYLNAVKTGHGLKIFLIIIVGYFVSIWISGTLIYQRKT